MIDRRELVDVCRAVHMRIPAATTDGQIMRTIAWARPAGGGWRVRILAGPGAGTYPAEDRAAAEALMHSLTWGVR